MKTMTKLKNSKNMVFIVINHLAQDLGSYVKAENPTGGRAPLYLSDVIVQLTKKSSDFEKSLKLGQKVEFEVTKSRWGKGKCKIPFYICFGRGISMIPTFKEILEDVSQPNGQKVLEIRGGGNGSLFLNGEEYKFRRRLTITRFNR